MDDRPSTIPTQASCAHCQAEAQSLKSVSPGEEPIIDDIYLCPICGELSRLGLLGWVKLTPEEFASLSPEEINDLTFAVRAIKAHIQQQ